jgi:hypothetical protein
MKLRDEMNLLVKALSQSQIPYALCGGLAMAMHGWPRATLDIDLLVEEQSLPLIREMAKKLGYRHESGFATFSEGRVKLFRLVKLDGEEFLPLDILLVTPDLKDAWNTRQQIDSDSGPISVVSTSGLIQMKTMRGNGTDQEDIRKLKGELNEAG